METNKNDLSAFSDETLNEMAMEDLEGGIGDGNNVFKCPTTTITNNCSGGNCILGCGSTPTTPTTPTVPPTNLESSIVD